MSQGTGSASSQAGEAALDARKKLLEVQKLKAEVAAAQRPWWKRAFQEGKAPEWITAAVAVGTVTVVLTNGYFSASRERLAAEGDRLAVEKIDMEQKRDRATAELAAKEKELADVKQRLNPFEKEQEAIEQLRKFKADNVMVQFSTDFQFDGVSLWVHRSRWDVSWDTLRKKNKYPPPASLANARDLFEPLAKFRKLKGVKIDGVQLSKGDLAALSVASGAESIGLKNCGLTNETLDALKLPESTRYLFLQASPLTFLQSFRDLRALSTSVCGTAPSRTTPWAACLTSSQT